MPLGGQGVAIREGAAFVLPSKTNEPVTFSRFVLLARFWDFNPRFWTTILSHTGPIVQRNKCQHFFAYIKCGNGP